MLEHDRSSSLEYERCGRKLNAENLEIQGRFLSGGPHWAIPNLNSIFASSRAGSRTYAVCGMGQRQEVQGHTRPGFRFACFPVGIANS